MNRKLLIRRFLFVAMLGLFVQEGAFAQLRPGPDRRPDRGGAGQDYHRGEGRVEEYVGREVSNRSLPLGRLLDLGREYRGMAIREIVVETARSRRGAQIELVADRRVIDRQYAQGTTVLRPERRMEIGDELRTLQLYVEGSAFIERVVVYLEGGRGDGPHPPGRGELVIGGNTYQRLEGHRTTPVDFLLGRYRDVRGYDLNQLVLRMRADFGRGQVWLALNGRPLGPAQFVDVVTRDLFFDLRRYNLQGKDLRGLELVSQGRFTIDYAAVFLSPGRNGNVGRIGRP